MLKSAGRKDALFRDRDLNDLVVSWRGNLAKSDGRRAKTEQRIPSLIDLVLSWSIEDISDEQLFATKVADSCITTVVLVANILTDNPNLLPGISKDLSFLHGLLDILPFVSNDSQARSALWRILARVLSTAEANAMRKLDLQQYAMLLVEKSHIINEDLDDHRGEDFAEDHTDAGKSNAKKGTVSSSY